MKRTILALAVCTLLSAPLIARGGGGHGGGHSGYGRSSFGGEHYTRSYTTRSGTLVLGHYDTNPNRTRNDNYSTRGNFNPHTGAWGTKPRDEDGPH